MIDKNTKIYSVPFPPITLFDFLSLKTDPSRHRWDKLSKKTKLLLKDTVRYALERRESENPDIPIDYTYNFLRDSWHWQLNT